jgi:type IV pilus assembly protein PilW
MKGVAKLPACLARAAPGQPAHGFSLVEMMVALVIGLLVTSSMISVFIGTRTASKTTSGVASLTDNGRIALDFLQQGVRSAGFMACNTPPRQINSLTAGTSPAAVDYVEPLGGYEAAKSGPGVQVATVSATATTNVTADASASDWNSTATGGELDPMLAGLVVAGSDVLVVHTLLPQTPPNPPTVYLTAPAAINATSVTVSAVGGLQKNQVALISNCSVSFAVQITGIKGSVVSLAQPLPIAFDAGSQVGVADTIAYFIGVDGSSHNSALFAFDMGGFASPTSAQIRELVPDIENMQILYGIDTTGAQAVTQYVTADQVANLSNAGNFNGVLNVRIAVLAASPLYAAPANRVGATVTAISQSLAGTTVTPPTDTRLRRVFELTVSVRNDGV